MNDVKVNQSEGIVTSNEAQFYDPEIYPPPRGVEMWVIQRGGVLIKSPWSDNSGFLAWCPMPKMPAWLKKKLTESYLKGANEKAADTTRSDA